MAEARGTEDDALVPGPQLRLSGIPPIAKATAERIARYTALGPTEVVAWHPTRRELLVAMRHGATMQLHRIEGPRSTPVPLTTFDDPVREAAYAPTDGDLLIYARDHGGDEAAQLEALTADGATTALTDRACKHGMAAWNGAGTAIAYTSLPLDRTGDRGPLATTLSVMDPRDPRTVRVVASLPGGGWQDLVWVDERTIVAIDYRSVVDSSIWSIDVASGARTRVLPAVEPAPGARTVSYEALRATADGRRLVFTSDEDGEFRRLVVFDRATGERRCLTADVPWDVVDLALPEVEGTGPDRIAAIVNVDGRHVLRVFDVAGGDEVPLPPPPDAIATGSVSRVRHARRVDGDEIAFSVSHAGSPGDVWSLVPGADGRWIRWTTSAVDLDRGAWRAAAIVRWPSFDGREISGLITRPPERFAGPRPVLVHIHGGPESQATVGYLGVANRFVEELGIAYLQPNVRGSTGYGRTFVSLDDGLRREDAVKDVGALLDWIATQPDLDATRVLVAGRSYGGFMSLAVAVAYPERIVGSIAVVGISHFATFLERTETYRRDLRRVEYGDERDPVVRAFFDRISPLANADRIRKPLFVVAGRNDPRVPYEESERIVAKVRGRGIPVWHLVADDEGHSFARKPNIDFVAAAEAAFVERYLLGRA